MKVYRNNIFLMNNASDVPYKKAGSRWVNKDGKKVPLVPVQFTIIYTGSEFQSTTIGETTLTAGNYYYYNGRDAVSNIAIWELTDNETALAHSEIPIFNIMEGTYTGKDMGERSITAQIDFPSRIDFQIGDFVKFDIANLLRANGVAGGNGEEKFYIYTMPTVKKVARAQSFGKAFQHTVTFYPCQYELATVKMRDVLQEISSGVIYTGYDEFSFYGGANTLMKRIMAVLNERFGSTGVAGKDYWSYQIADSINEDKNTALEKFQFDFSDSSVMDALLKLNDAEGVNTKFFINERIIYVGYKRPYITGVDSNNIQRSVPFEFMYGKTSHMPIETNYGNLFTLTKSNGSASPITRLYAYGADRNLHRFYCSDRIKTGRYVNKLMLPSFEDDGRTDYIDSPEGIARFGIREGTKNFENIYPSLRFFYYGNLRDVKYCIKLMGSGLESDSDGVYDGGTSIAKASLTSEQIERAKSEVDRAKYDGITNTAKVIITVGGQDYTLTVAEADQLINKGTVHLNGKSGGVYNYPIARVQCYRVEELTKIVDGATVHTGLNRLVESAPPVDLAVFCHATGKVVKVVLYADKNGQTSIQRQLAADGKIPTRTLNGTDYIVGSCFAVHDANFGCGHIDAANTYPGRPNGNLREAWFQDADTISTDRDGSYDRDYEIYKNQVSIHQIHYTDDHWITDVYEFESYDQERFNRQGYSAYCWPRVNKHYPESQSDNIEVNAVVDVGPVLIEDTDLNTSEGKQQQTFDIYLRDVGFKINEQTWFGDRVFLFDTCKINFLDGNLAGYEFEMPAESDSATLGSIYVPALKPDGSRNDEFFDLADNPSQAEQAYLKGAFWRIVAKRAETDVDRYWVPNVMLNANAGDHIVFLDIFMPDIYVRVAEQRLLKEAKKYLDANDDGDIQYSFDLDKVRPNEQPIFALQMREGAIMRVVDDDLDIGTVNGSKTLFDDKNGLVSMQSMQKYDVSVETNYEVVERTRDDLESTQGARISYDETNHEYYLFFDTLLGDVNKDMYYGDGLTIYWGGSGISFKTKADNILGVEHTGSGTSAAQHKLRLKNIDFLKGYKLAVEHWDWKVQYCFEQTILTPQIDQTILPSGVRRYCAANNLTEFEAGKYYEVVIDTMEDRLAVHDGAVPRFALVNGLGDGQTIYNPEYTAENMTPSGASYKRYKYKFTLPDEFNDNEDYYPAILYASNGQTDVVHVRLMSIIEQDGERLGDINYVDLSIDTVTIRFHDNTREARVSLQEGQEPERLTTNQTEMVRTVTATVKEESRATAWAQLMDRVADAEQLQDQTLDFYQNLVIAARRHYIELMNLRNNIFDPDGTCKETFLQIMMLQVGADSMNYQLKYTHYSMNGHTANCGLRFDTEHPTTEKTDSDSGKAYIDSFFIGNAEEVLDHYVYTDHPSSGEGGRWYPQERNRQWKLHKVAGPDNTDIYPVYFIALKASLTDPRDCHWVCEPTQHTTNELVNGSTGYFYFNWGILAPESESVGKYTLTETRGNAYMYGDNLICGQISTLAGNSYFDLTHGNFVLSKNGPDEHGQYHDGLTYINGVLTIYGINDNDVNSVLTRLGLIQNTTIPAIQQIITNNQLYVQALEQSLQNQIDGVVDSWFMEGIPTMDNAPANDWKVYNEHDVLDPTETAKEYARHEGDTYTNIRNYGDELASENWEQGRVYYGSDFIGKTFEQSKSSSGDSNHIKGVRFNRIVQYKAGDSIWLNTNNGAYDVLIIYFDNQGKQAVQNYYSGSSNQDAKEIVLNSSYTKFSISIRSTSAITVSIVPSLSMCVNPKAGHSWRFCKGTGENPATWHWHEIADSDAVKALQDAAQAQDTADGKRRCFTTQPVPPYDPGDLWVNANGTDTTANPNITYVNALLRCNTGKAKGQSFDIHDWEYSSRAITAADDAQAAADDANRKVDNIANDGIISGGTEKSTLKKEWQEIAGDNMLHTVNGSYKKAVFQATLYGITSSQELQDIGTAYSRLEYAMKEIVGYSNDAWTDGHMSSDTYIGADYTNPSTGVTAARYDIYLMTDGVLTAIDRDKFAKLWREYYDAEIALLDAITKLIDEREIGGENLCILDGGRYDYENTYESSGYVDDKYIELFQTGFRPQGGGIIRTYVPAGKYVFSAKEVYGTVSNGGIPVSGVTFELQGINQNGSRKLYGKYISGENVKELITVNEPCSFRIKVTYRYSQGNSVVIRLVDVMFQRGTKPTAYQDYVKHLTDALHGTTEIAGGLVMTNLLMLKDEDGNVQAGMSGLTDYKIENGVIENHGVTLFSGGGYEKALQQAQAAALGTLDQLTSLLPVLLTKTGIGSNIGCFRVLSDTAVEVVSKNGGRIVIDAGNASSSPSIKFFDTNGDCLININGNALPTINIDSKSISSYSWYVAHDFYSGTVLATESLTQSSLYGVTYNGANNIKIAGFSMGLYAASGVNATGYDIYFELYFGEKKIATASFYDSTTVYSDGSMYVNLYIGISKFYSISQGTYNITVRNLRAKMINNNGNWQNAGWTRIDGLYFGNGTSDSGWTDGNILFSTQSEDSITLGKNGLLITSSGGGVTEFRNRETNNYVRFIGLPNSATDDGQLYKDWSGNLKVRV